MPRCHALVWLDHLEAHVMHISPDDVETSIVKPHKPHHKLQLAKHSHAHDGELVSKVVGVECVDQPTDGQLVAYARKYFQAKDLMG
jgi:hypothetical protein